MDGQVERMGGSPESRKKHAVDVIEGMPDHMLRRFKTHLERTAHSAETREKATRLAEIESSL